MQLLGERDVLLLALGLGGAGHQAQQLGDLAVLVDHLRHLALEAVHHLERIGEVGRAVAAPEDLQQAERLERELLLAHHVPFHHLHDFAGELARLSLLAHRAPHARTQRVVVAPEGIRYLQAHRRLLAGSPPLSAAARAES